MLTLFLPSTMVFLGLTYPFVTTGNRLSWFREAAFVGLCAFMFGACLSDEKSGRRRVAAAIWTMRAGGAVFLVSMMRGVLTS